MLRRWRYTSYAILVFGGLACARITPPAGSAALKQVVQAPPYRLTLNVVDGSGNPAPGILVRIMECCHTERGPCGRLPVNAQGRVTIDVCPDDDGIVRATLTPNPRAYRVPPIMEFEVKSDREITVAVTKHEAVLEHLKAD